jgi:hypothetical protein
VGRDVGRDEGRDQETWRDLVARLEIPAFIEAADAPWPDRENLRPRHTSTPASPAADDQDGPGSEPASSPAPADTASVEVAQETSARPVPADRSRIIRPAGFTRFCGPANFPADGQAEPAADGSPPSPEDLAASGASPVPGPRDYALTDEDPQDNRYIPPPLPPQPKLDPVAKGAWLALFGGPGYLLLATLLNWQLAGWTELASVTAFITGFVILVFRLGDGPSKRDGPDQGAVV